VGFLVAHYAVTEFYKKIQLLHIQEILEKIQVTANEDLAGILTVHYFGQGPYLSPLFIAR